MTTRYIEYDPDLAESVANAGREVLNELIDREVFHVKQMTVYVPGARVWKNPPGKKSNPKPFKSGFLVNTVKGYTRNPNSRDLAYTFVEDDSFVDCRKCSLAPDSPTGDAAPLTQIVKCFT